MQRTPQDRPPIPGAHPSATTCRYELFLDTIRAEQMTGGAGDGNLPVNVPAAAPSRPMDISWTAAYPLIAHWPVVLQSLLGI